MTRWLQALCAALALCIGSIATAHELSMAEMELRQLSPTEFLWQWTASGNRPASQDLTPRWPEGCHEESNLLRCDEAGLQGALTMDGVGKRYSAAMVKIVWLDGQSRVYTMTAAQPTVRLYGSADDRRGMGEIASAYTQLGVEHILTGYDHLLFVLGLLFLVGLNRRLLITITAFTLAHSLPLALSALGWLVLRPPPVEAVIALSIVLVAAESLHQRDTLSRRWPALVALLFGLVHGLGFAGALKEIGLPQQHLWVALGCFNVGVELGQLGVIASAWALVHLLSTRMPLRIPLSQLRTPALYGIGSLAAYWTLSRGAAILG